MTIRKIYFLFLFTILLTFLLPVKMIAQSIQQQKTDSVFKLIGYHLTLQDADGIYRLTGTQFRKALNIEAFREVANKQLFPLGPIKKTTLLSFVNNKTATYKVQFDVLTMQVLLSLDENGKIDLFYFRPFKIEPIDKINPAATSNPLKSQQDKLIDSVARTYIQKINTVGLSIGVIKNGLVSSYNYGETVKGNGHLPNGETLFEIGAVTKTFTATLLAAMVNEGKIKLTDHIIKYLPDSVAANPELKDITIVNLVNHTSGLPVLPDNLALQKPYDALNPYANYNSQLLFSYFKTCKLATKPGEHYVYSNLGMGMLGVILSKISGKPFEEMVAEIICSPLGMKNTIQHIYPLLKTRFAAVYNDEGKPTAPWEFDVLASCGALRSNMDDMLLYTKANLNDNGMTPLSKAFKLAHEITYQGDAKLAMAWHIIVVDGVSYYFHDGGTYGSSSFLAFNKEKNLAVIILSNASATTTPMGVNLLRDLQAK